MAIAAALGNGDPGCIGFRALDSMSAMTVGAGRRLRIGVLRELLAVDGCEILFALIGMARSANGRDVLAPFERGLRNVLVGDCASVLMTGHALQEFAMDAK